MTTTHTFATLEVSPKTYQEIKRRLKKATGSSERVKRQVVGKREFIDMDGIGLVVKSMPKHRVKKEGYKYQHGDRIVHSNRGPGTFVHYCGASADSSESFVQFDDAMDDGYSDWDRVSTSMLKPERPKKK